MPHYIPKILLFVLLSLSLATCNDDVFEHDTRLSTDRVELAGDADSLSLRFEPRGLERITVVSLSTAGVVSYYNKAGESIGTDASASEVARIVYTTSQTRFEIRIQGRTLQFVSQGNKRLSALAVRLELDYGYVVRRLTLSVRPE